MVQARTYLKTILAVLLISLIAGCSTIGTVTADNDNVTRIQVISEPPGATIYLMGVKAGVTPTVINDRDIYPVSYKPETEKYYGRVILRKEGCKEFTKRLTRKEVRGGLVVRLDCGDGTAKAPAQKPAPIVQPATIPVHEPRSEASASSPGLPAQQLEQLRVLQQLQEQGVISDDEERKLRKRILNTLP